MLAHISEVEVWIIQGISSLRETSRKFNSVYELINRNYTVLGNIAILLKSFFFIFSHQYTPLSVAAEKNHVDTVKCLIDNGADVNVCDENRVRE